MDQNLFATDPDLKKGFLANVVKQNKRNKSRTKRTMPAKRKRSYSSRRTYKRRRTAPSASATAKALARLTRQVGPFGVPGSATMTEYGPSREQMMNDPSLFRSPAQTQARLRDNYRGPGDYMQAGEMIGGGIGGLAGAIGGTALLGPGVGTAAGLAALGTGGAALGGGIGHAIDVFTGQGDYGKTVNQIVTGGRTPIAVNQGQDRTGDIYISQTEYLGNVTASEAFRIEEYELNPGIHKTFPFLSQLANNYELYEWDGLMVCYKPLSGEGGSDNVLGKIILCTNYDPTAPKFNNSLEMQNYDYCSTGKPSQTVIHGIETAGRSKVTNMMYVRNSETTRDKVFTDIGKLFVATEGMPSSANGAIGELHITYRIRLSRAKLFATLGNFGMHGQLYLSSWPTSESSALTSQQTQGDKLFEIAYDSVSSTRLKLKLADKDFVSGTFLVTVMHKYESGENQGLWALSTPPSQAANIKLLNWKSPVNGNQSSLVLVKSDAAAADTDGGDIIGIVSLTNAVTNTNDVVAIAKHIVRIDNPNDGQPFLWLNRGYLNHSTEVFTPSSTYASNNMVVMFEQVDNYTEYYPMMY